MTRPDHLADLTWEEAQNHQLLDPVIFLPVGATEAHGPHLPLSTDTLISSELAARALRAWEARGGAGLIAPALAYAVTEFGAPFSGTVSLRPETAQALYADVICGLHRSGFLRVCVVNSHLEPAHVAALRRACAEAAQRSGRAVAFPDHTERRWARTLTEEYRRGKCHAGRYETSLLLAGAEARPRVRREIAAALPPNDADFLAAVREGAGTFPAAGGPRAYFGDPAAATAREGDEIYHRLVEMIVATIEETWPVV
jgi:creatinine amidohydrolase